MPKVMVVDDHDLPRNGLIAILSAADDLRVVAEAKTGREAIDLARKSLPDVVLTDVRMPNMDGPEATRRTKEERPRTAVIIVTSHESPKYLRQAVEAGAAGDLLKDVTRERLVNAVRETAERLVLSPETVKSHVAAILSELELSDPTQAAVHAVRHGLAQPVV